MKKRMKCTLVVLLMFVAAPGICSAARLKVLDRARVGNYTEDITFVDGGRFRDHVAIVDGYEVLGLPVYERVDEEPDGPSDEDADEWSDRSRARKLFDIRDIGIQLMPRGIAYAASANRFVFNDPTQREVLFFTDDKGRLTDRRTVRYLGAYMPDHVEALLYLPEASLNYPDHLMMITWSYGIDPGSRLQVLDLDGQVVHEILPDPPLQGEFMVGLTRLGPDRFLATLIDASLWVMDFSGQILEGPVWLPDLDYFEGIAVLPDGRVAGATIGDGTLYLADEDLNRLPADDMSYIIGVGASRPIGITWNSDTDRFVLHVSGRRDPGQADLLALPATFDASEPVGELTDLGYIYARRLAYLPDERLTAVAHYWDPKAILLIDAGGNILEEVDLSGVGRPFAITYIPGQQRFAVRLVEQPLALQIVERNGSPFRVIDLTSTGFGGIGAVAYFDPDHPSGGRFLLCDLDSTRSVVTDLDGNLLDEFDYHDELGVLFPSDVTAVRTGPHAGALAMVDADNNEIVVFELK